MVQDKWEAALEGLKDIQLGILQKVTELFLSNVILHNTRLLFKNFNDEMISSLSFLCWCTENAVRGHLEQLKVGNRNLKIEIFS